MSSSPAPYSYNLVAPTTASLGGDRPAPLIPGQPSILWELPGEGIHSHTQRLCITCQGVLLTEQDAQACMEQPGGVAESDPSVAPQICKTRGDRHSIHPSIYALDAWPMPVSVQQPDGHRDWTEVAWALVHQNGEMGSQAVLHFLLPQLGGGSKHKYSIPFLRTPHPHLPPQG